MPKSNLYFITTRNGQFLSTGETEHAAKIQFTISYPNEKIRTIQRVVANAVAITGLVDDEVLEELL